MNDDARRRLPQLRWWGIEWGRRARSPIISVNCFLRMCALAEENSEIVKLGKCHAFSPTEATMLHPALDNLPDGVIKHPSHGRGLGDDKRLHAGVLVLQLPLGTDEYCIDILNAINAKTKVLLNTVVDLSRYDSEPATQCAMQLLIYCAHPKFVHVTRTLPPAVTLGPARRHDVQILQCLSSIMGHDDPLCATCRHPNTARCCHSLEWVHAADLASRQAQLPMRLGGFGLTSMETISSIGYLSGFAHTMIFLASAGQTLSIPDLDLPRKKPYIDVYYRICI